MGCSSSVPVGEQQVAPVDLADASPALKMQIMKQTNADGTGSIRNKNAAAAAAAETTKQLASKSGLDPTQSARQRTSPPDPDPAHPDSTHHSGRRLHIKPAGSTHSRNHSHHHSHHESPKPAERELSTSRVMRVAEDEPDLEATPERILAAQPPMPVRARSHSVSLPSDRASRLHGGDESPLPGASSRVPIGHLGLSPAGPRSHNGKRSEVSLAQQILQRQANAAHGVENLASGSRPGTNQSLRRPSHDHSGSPRPRHDRAHSVSIDLMCPLTLPSAHNVPRTLFEHVATPSSSHRDLSVAAAGGTSSPHASPQLRGFGLRTNDKWAARTEELWTHYAGRTATHMPKKALLQLSEDLFSEFLAKYREKLSAEFAAAHAKHPTKKIYTDEQREKDLRKDLPFLLPAKPSSGGEKPEPDDYVHYIYRFATREMRRHGGGSNAAGAGGGTSVAAGGVGSIRAGGAGIGTGSITTPSTRSKRGGGNMFNLESPIGPAHSHSPGGAGLGSTSGAHSERHALLSRAEFTMGWGHCHEMLFKCMDAEKERPGTPCKLM